VKWKYSSTHSFTSALDVGEWSASRPGPFYPQGKSPWWWCWYYITKGVTRHILPPIWFFTKSNFGVVNIQSNTERCSIPIITPSYSCGTEFEPKPRAGYSHWSLSLLTSIPPGNYSNITLKQAVSFHILPNHSLVQHYNVWGWESIAKAMPAVA
jgi:hypothetical protein